MKARIILTLMLSLASTAMTAQLSVKIEPRNGDGFVIVENAHKRVLAYSSNKCDTTNPGLMWWVRSIEQLPEAKIANRNAPTPSALGFPDHCESFQNVRPR